MSTLKAKLYSKSYTVKHDYSFICSGQHYDVTLGAFPQDLEAPDYSPDWLYQLPDTFPGPASQRHPDTGKFERDTIGTK
jgi:hypothetical protein